MALIVLARLYLDGQHLAMLLYYKIELALFLTIELEQVVILRKAMSIEFLCHKILENSAEVYVGILL